MKKNVGKVDSYIRFALGIGFIILAFTVSLWFLIGAGIAIVTALTGMCPLYTLFGISTCKVEPK